MLNPIVGQKVQYIAFPREEQNGIIKSLIEDDIESVYVVYKCDGDWDNYQNYTAEKTNIYALRKGWRLAWEEKVKKFLAKNGRELFREKTPLDELPLELKHGSTTHHPGRKGGITTADVVLWCRFQTDEWFRPYGRFTTEQIIKMYDICYNDNQVISLFELLSAKKQTI